MGWDISLGDENNFRAYAAKKARASAFLSVKFGRTSAIQNP
jgi:hypothetical protein